LWSELLAPLVNMIKDGGKKNLHSLSVFITMSKTKEYRFRFSKKIVELHKVENICNKIAKALKIKP